MLYCTRQESPLLATLFSPFPTSQPSTSHIPPHILLSTLPSTSYTSLLSTLPSFSHAPSLPPSMHRSLPSGVSYRLDLHGSTPSSAMMVNLSTFMQEQGERSVKNAINSDLYNNQFVRL